ncbi:PTS sugar transporter subunit IIC [uncultured Lactobacillus sp.]|uniref:PTS sugar transporter subunit IIC n=1 Tax=uncultured Lactobacillus sp. TaxID=153152 RepID=UPI002635E104|nr:PTS transporter subunit EIIC [uncultured Lactobacillus sp.]
MDNKYKSFINKHIIPPVVKFVNLRAMKALANGMVYTLPFILVGSIFLILANIPIPAVANAIKASGWEVLFNQVYTTSFGFMALWAVFGIAYEYTKADGHGKPASSGLIALGVFFLLQSLQIANPLVAAMGKSGLGITDAAGKVLYTGSQLTHQIDKLPDAVQNFLTSPVTGVINNTWLGGQGMVASIIIGLLVGWSYSAIIKRGWKITLPSQVPGNIADQFDAMIPAGIILTVSMFVFAFFKEILHTDFLQFIYHTIQIPLQGIPDSFWGITIMAFFVSFFWLFGVHGGIIVGSITSAMLSANSFDNAALFKAGKLSVQNGAHIVTAEFFNNFVNITGSGITIGLLIYALVFAKSVKLKSMGKIEAIPGIFNINEPFLFGLPIVMNPWLAIPFFLTPVISVMSTYLLMKSGIIPPLTGISVPWTIPPIIQGAIAGGWKVGLWQAVVLLISVVIYLPFARRYDKYLMSQEKAVSQEK